MKKIAITFGDPNGISPEIIIKALNILNIPPQYITLITSKNILSFYKENYNLYCEQNYPIVEIPFLKENLLPGKETKESGDFAFKSLKRAIDLAKNKEIQAIVTAPLSKNAIKLAGYNYSGQTEILEHYLSSDESTKAEMLFVCDNFFVFLLTRHIALKEVSKQITKDNIIEKVKRLDYSLKNQIGIKNPKMAICALNPHAGENGLFGEEEKKEIIPAIKQLQNEKINIEGPFPSDTLFIECLNKTNKYNCYIAMYHDQGLIPIKLLNRDNCVNTTIGLGIIRTSPAHGTAFDIAGKIIANPQSMVKAIEIALNH